MTPPAKKTVPSMEDMLKKKEEEKKTEETTEKATEETNTNTDSIEFTSDDENKYESDSDKENKPFLSDNVVSLKANKTPAELAAETPDETAKRYGIDTSITKEDAENPRVQVYEDTHVRQVPSGTHLHPDIAKDLMNRGISQHTTDSAQVTRSITQGYDFAGDAETNDKF